MILLLLACTDDKAISLTETTDDSGTVPTTPAPTDTAVAASCDGETAALVMGVGFESIAEAVVGAEAGATVQVCQGRWPANVTVPRDMTLEGDSGAILTGGVSGPVILIPSGVTVSLVNLWIDGGWSDTYAGGVVVLGTGVIRDSLITGSTGGDGGGVSVLGEAGQPATLSISYSTVQGNQAENGGGIYAEQATIQVVATALADNVALAEGGGFWCGTSSCGLDHVDVTANTAAVGGGGFVSAWSAARVTQSTVERNSADSGGGIEVRGDGAAAPISLEEVVVSGNLAAGEGGGVRYFAAEPSPPVTIWASTFSANGAEAGGALWVGGVADPVTAEDSAFTANSATRGGGIFLSGRADALVLTGVDLTENEALGAGGAVWSAGSAYLAGGAVTGSTAGEGGGAWMEGGSLISDAVDWGSGDSENVVGDVAIADGPTYARFGADASFTCDADATLTCQ